MDDTIGDTSSAYKDSSGIYETTVPIRAFRIHRGRRHYIWHELPDNAPGSHACGVQWLFSTVLKWKVN